MNETVTGMHSKIIGVHLNYRSRAAERGRVPAYPSYFLKPASTLAGDGDTAVRPAGCELLGFEGEIAVVIGAQVKDVAPDDAWSHVGWVTAANDLGVYDLRYADAGSNLRSKGIDGYTPVGPRFLAAGEIDPAALRVRTWVNGEIRQDAVTGDDLLFSFAQIIADLSRLMTLEAGDLILTGTPGGASVAEPGDLVEVEVSSAELSTGRLRTPIVAATNALQPYGAMPKTDTATRQAAYGSRWTGADAGQAAGRGGQQPGAEVEAGLRVVSTATLASQLRKRNLSGFIMDDLRSSRPDCRMVGRARTLRYLPLRDDLFAQRGGGMNAQKRAIDQVQAGEVLVMEARGETTAGTIGDILALRAKVRGAAGIVTDGAVRDRVAIGELPIPVYHRSVHPAVLGRRHVPWETDVPIACAGVLVCPGDTIVGDADGVVVLPDHLLEDIVIAAVEQERQERFIVQQVQAGESIDGLYPIGEKWRAAYESWREQ
jgi:2-keto-4-pentenoate hydratase/2-oxohepta-3-ene-1,7-dioic acid hydratase in catechol pathway/regulator of RNase E activity RraA